MKPFCYHRKALIVLSAFLFVLTTHAQTKKLKRPNSRVCISSVDNFVQESFDLYNKVYIYDNYAEKGTPLTDDDIDVLADALSELDIIYESAPNIISDIQGHNALKQAKATLQVNRAKKALKYSIKTAKELLAGERKKEEDTNDEASTEESDSSIESESSSTSNGGTNETESSEQPNKSNVSDNLKVYSKFDFVPGDKLLFFDDFSNDFVGDFPSKWNTNGTGEVITIEQVEGKWFQLKAGYSIFYLPLVNNTLPDEYTIEFDLLVKGIDKQTSSTAMLQIRLDENNGFKDGDAYAFAGLPLGQYGAFDIRVTNRNQGPNQINSALKTDIRSAILNKPHVSIAVNKKRFRLWINQKKHVDIPEFIYAPESIKHLKFSLKGLKDGKDKVFITNLKIAEGGVDLRRKLMNEGKISTNGILFDSGSANIKPQSYGIIRQISQVLVQDNSINLNIVGHTDADGNDDANMKLSKQRADAVKQALIDIFNVSGNRLQTQGKGESEPVGDNTTTDGKAQNRRVEFIKV